MHKQHDLGYLSDETLRELARTNNVPLYRLEELVSFYTAFRRTPASSIVIDACRDVCCSIAGHRAGVHALEQAFKQSDIDCEIREVSCLGRCDSAPAAAINSEPTAPVKLSETDQFLKLLHGRRVDDSIEAADSPDWVCNIYASPSDFYGTVRKLLKSQNGLVNRCIEELKDSKLSGRGGAGFPTGVKWELVSQEESDTKYVICNADESEPGTFKDREILRHAPHLIIEGMVLGGLTIGAEQGVVYIRHEYSREKDCLQQAIDHAYQLGVLGENASSSGQRFDLEIFVSPGGYILGEETALLEALEDKRGEPRNKPPYPGQQGLWGQPTLINNVETFALVPAIVAHGAQWWTDQGCRGFSGLKFVCVSGDVCSPGVFEVPMGTTFAEVIDMAGGVTAGKALKAFLPGGASSLFLTSEQLETPIDVEAVKQAGSMLGTGAIMVFHEDRNLYDIATSLTRFFRNESCGKCVPCRIGTERAVNLLESVAAGQHSRLELDLLDDLNSTLLERRRSAGWVRSHWLPFSPC